MRMTERPAEGELVACLLTCRVTMDLATRGTLQTIDSDALCESAFRSGALKAITIGVIFIHLLQQLMLRLPSSLQPAVPSISSPSS